MTEKEGVTRHGFLQRFAAGIGALIAAPALPTIEWSLVEVGDDHNEWIFINQSRTPPEEMMHIYPDGDIWIGPESPSSMLHITTDEDQWEIPLYD